MVRPLVNVEAYISVTFQFFNEPEGGLIDYCFEEQPFGDIQNISRIIMNFKDGGSYVAGNVTISGKAPCEGELYRTKIYMYMLKMAGYILHFSSKTKYYLSY